MLLYVVPRYIQWSHVNSPVKSRCSLLLIYYITLPLLRHAVSRCILLCPVVAREYLLNPVKFLVKRRCFLDTAVTFALMLLDES